MKILEEISTINEHLDWVFTSFGWMLGLRPSIQNRSYDTDNLVLRFIVVPTRPGLSIGPVLEYLITKEIINGETISAPYYGTMGTCSVMLKHKAAGIFLDFTFREMGNSELIVKTP